MKSLFRDFFSDLSQTFFIGNPSYGALLFFGVLIFSPVPAISGLIAGLISTAYGRHLKPNKLLFDSGLFGMNGFFVGLGLASLMQIDWVTPLWIAVAALVTAVFVLFTYRILLNWQFPVLVLPYALVVLILWSIHPQSDRLTPRTVGVPVPQDLASSLALGIPNSFSEIFYQSNPYLGGALMLFLLTTGRGLFLHAVAGSILANTVAAALGLSRPLLANGYWGFSGILVAIALGVGYRGMEKSLVAIAVVASVLMMAAMTTVFGYLGLMPLGLPYLCVVWIFLAVASRQPKREPMPVRELWRFAKPRAASLTTGEAV